MINTVKVTNYLGDAITISLANPSSSGFAVSSITGLGPVKANINTTEVATNDGSIYNSARLDPRNIVLDIIFYGSDIETLRQKTYKYFPIKKQLTLEFETDNRTATINGYVESNEPNIFTRSENTRISIVCPDPYFYSVTEDNQVTVFSGITPEFEFEWENNAQEYVTEKKRLNVPWQRSALFSTGNPNYTSTSTTRLVSAPGWAASMKEEISVTLPTGWNGEILEFTSWETMDATTLAKPFPGWNPSSVHTITAQSDTGYCRLYAKKSNSGAISIDEMNDFAKNVIVEQNQTTYMAPSIEFGRLNIVTDANIYYNGDAEVGVSILIHVTGIARDISIYKLDTRESMLIDTSKIESITGAPVSAGDDILICTVKGRKSIKLRREGQEYNILNALNRNADWFQLAKGDNVFAYSAYEGINHIQFRVENDTLYEGI